MNQNRIADLAEPTHDDSVEPSQNGTTLALASEDPSLVPVTARRVPYTRPRALIGFNGAQIVKATETLPEDQKQAVRWFHAHCYGKGDDMATAARRIGKDKTVLFRVFQGKYPAGLDSITASINTYRRLAEARDKVGRPPFIQTSISKKVWNRCEMALHLQRVCIIIGDWQIGKSYAAEAYKEEHNHGQTKLVRLPAGCGYKIALESIAKACSMPHKVDLSDLRENILSALDSRHLLIIDEVDEPLAGRFSGGALQIYSFIREIYDQCRCGLVLIGNSTFEEALTKKGPMGKWMAKLRRRAMKPLILDSSAPDEDLWALAAYYGLPVPAKDTQAYQAARIVAAGDGLGQYVIYLQAAKRGSTMAQQEITWEHFLAAIAEMDGEALSQEEVY